MTIFVADMIEKNTLPGVDEYFQHMVKALILECEDLNNRHGCQMAIA